MSDNVLNMFFSDEEINKGEVKSPKDEQTHETTSTTSLEKENEVELKKVESEEKSEKQETEAGSKKETETKEELFVQADGQFSLFGGDAITEDKAEETPSTAKKSASTKTASSKKSTAPKKKKIEDLDITEEWTIHYATHSFNVTDFINPMPSSGIVKAEDIRQEMEKEFFEMTKERTKWDFDEKQKRLFPDVIGTTKGAL